MRTGISIVVFVGIALALLIVQMSGIAGVLGLQTDDYKVDDRVRSVAEEKPSAEGTAIGQSPSALSFMTSALGTFISWVLGVFLLPVTFDKWAPWYMAYPFGLGLQGLAIWGFAQAAGGEWR